MRSLAKGLLLMVAVAFTVVSSSLAAENPPIEDFKIRAFHLDGRAEVMTIGALRGLAEQLASIGCNAIVMEYEQSYPYDKHATISGRYAYTRKEVAEFVAYCGSLGIEVIPLQQCFGHIEYILRHTRYNHLAEDPKEPSQLCPLKSEEAYRLFEQMFLDMISLHPGRFFHIGGDETYLLGHCRQCAEKVAKEGKSKLFVDYMKGICDIVIKHGKIPVMWADIVLNNPEAIHELPAQTRFVDWNYGWSNKKFGNAERCRKEGLIFWGAPSIRSHPDNLYVTDWSKHFRNQEVFIPYSRALGDEAILMTSWSTSGLLSSIWDVSNEIVEMYPIRYVYPQSAFNLLVYMFGKAINQREPIDAEAVTIEYARERFGFTAAQGKLFYDLLNRPQGRFRHNRMGELSVVSRSQEGSEVVITKHSTSVEEQLGEAREAVAVMKGMRPTKNRNEWENLILMFRMRGNYLEGKQIEMAFESEDFNIGKAADLLADMQKVRREAAAIDADFIRLNRGYLHTSELQEMNRMRNLKQTSICERLLNMVKNR